MEVVMFIQPTLAGLILTITSWNWKGRLAISTSAVVPDRRRKW